MIFFLQFLFILFLLSAVLVQFIIFPNLFFKDFPVSSSFFFIYQVNNICFIIVPGEPYPVEKDTLPPPAPAPSVEDFAGMDSTNFH